MSLAVSLVFGGAGNSLSAEANPSPEAAKLFRRYCAACHGAQGRGDGPNAPSLGETQPRDLTDPVYMGKLSDAHLLRVISEGGRSVDRSPFMPAFGRTIPREQLLGLVAYVRGLHRRREAAERREPKPAEVGARLVVELGCLNCHKVGELSPQPVAPPLDSAGEKFQPDWLVEFLKAPRRIRPVGYLPLSRSRMPTFRLSQDEAESLAAYLLARRRGMNAQRAAAVCAKEDKGKGFQLLLRYGCRACHNFDGNGAVAGPDLESARDRLQRDWIARFIENPQSPDPGAAMPRAGVSWKDACAIANFLSKEDAKGEARGLPRRLVARGAALFKNLGCARCHGDAQTPKFQERPPDLTNLGDKVRPAWLRAFLKEPRPLRFWLKMRMPDFRLRDQEADALTSYFVLYRRDPKAKSLPRPEREGQPASPASIEEGKSLFALYECAKCHPAVDASFQAEMDTTTLAPSLRDAGRRLNPDWVLRFLRDPQSIYPGTKMPNFFYDSGEAIEEGADAKMIAIRDYLMSLNR